MLGLPEISLTKILRFPFGGPADPFSCRVSWPLASDRTRTVFLEDFVASVANGGAAVAMTLFCRAGVRGFGLSQWVWVKSTIAGVHG